MAKHPTSSRVHREEQAPDDAFVATIRKTVEWGRANSRALSIGGIVAAIIVVVGVYYISSQRQVEQEAEVRFAQLQQSVASGNAQLAIRDLQTFLETFGGTDAARRARLILGDILLSEDRPQEALDALGNLGTDLDDPFGIAAARLRAAAHEEVGEVDQAVDTYRRIAADARFTFQRREALADAARVRLQAGDAEAAADLYEDVVETFEEQEAGRGYFEMWLAEARAQAEQGAAAAIPAPTGEAGAAGAAGAAAGGADEGAAATTDTAGG